MNVKNGLVSGILRVTDKIKTKELEANKVVAPTFEGDLTGNASSATTSNTANTASSLTSKNIGDATHPVYVNGEGKPVRIEKVASAEDSEYSHKIIVNTGTDNVERVVFFADSATIHRVVKDEDFKYNPATNTLNITNGIINASTFTGKANSAAQADVATTASNAEKLNGKSDSYFSPSTHNHDSTYVNVSGDTMNGDLNVNGKIGVKNITIEYDSIKKCLNFNFN